MMQWYDCMMYTGCAGCIMYACLGVVLLVVSSMLVVGVRGVRAQAVLVILPGLVVGPAPMVGAESIRPGR